jgi:hypothetical protein
MSTPKQQLLLRFLGTIYHTLIMIVASVATVLSIIVSLVRVAGALAHGRPPEQRRSVFSTFRRRTECIDGAA